MNEYTPYVGPHDEVLQQTGLRYAINKAMHDLSSDELSQVVAFIETLPAKRTKEQDYRPASYYDQKRDSPTAVEPFSGADRWLYVV